MIRQSEGIGPDRPIQGFRSAPTYCKLQRQLQNAALPEGSGPHSRSRNYLPLQHLDRHLGFGIAGCPYMALPPFEAPRLLDMLKA